MTNRKVKLKSQSTRKKLLGTLRPGQAFNLVHSRIAELLIVNEETKDRRRPRIRVVSLEKARILWNQLGDFYHDTPDVVREVIRSCGDQRLASALKEAQRELDNASELYLQVLAKALESLAEGIALEQNLQPDADGHVIIC